MGIFHHPCLRRVNSDIARQLDGAHEMREHCVTQWCSIVLGGAECNGRHAASD